MHISNIYLDNASTTPLREEVAELMSQLIRKPIGNPSSSHKLGKEARSMIESARKTIADLLKIRSSQIIFTSGGTESNNMILKMSVQHLKIKYVITSPIEHKSVLQSLDDLSHTDNIILDFVSIEPDGSINLQDLEYKLKNTYFPTLVSLMHANHEIGNLLPLSKVARMCKKHGAKFHSDMSQTMGHYTLNLCEIDFASVSAHKFYGPKGVGFTFIKRPIALKPFIVGGGQERGLRAGTENVYGIVGMARALELTFQKLKKERSSIELLKKYAISRLRKKINLVRFNGLSSCLQKSLYTILNISLPIGLRSDLLVFQLDLKGIMVSKGSACISVNTSYVLEAISNKKEIESRSSLRISFGHYNKKKDIDALIDALKEYIIH